MVSLIVAKCGNVIGKRATEENGELAWRVRDETKFFLRKIRRGIVLVGRKTHDSIIRARGGLLPDVHTIVLSKTLRSVDGAEVCDNIEDGIRRALNIKRRLSYSAEVFIIGGREIYEQTIEKPFGRGKLVQKMHVSEILERNLQELKEGENYIEFPNFAPMAWNLDRNATEHHAEFDYFLYVRPRQETPEQWLKVA